MPTTRPADRKPKQGKRFYTFRLDGKTYKLPAAETVAGSIAGRYLRDASMDGEEGQLRLGFAMLEKLPDCAEAVDALYELPAGEMMTHVLAWLTFKPAEDEPSVGESSRSSA